MKSFTYADETQTYDYDLDDLLTQAGNFTIVRNADNGLPKSVTGDTLTLRRNFNMYGELESQETEAGGQKFASWHITEFDNTGIIKQKTETVGSIASQFVYEYDEMGRLEKVTKDGVLSEEYRYYPNGNRSYEMNALRGISGRNYDYDDEDRLKSAGDTTTFAYNKDGFLETKTKDALSYLIYL